METAIASLLTAIVVGVAVWWLTQYVGLQVSHRHRIIEEHTKKLHEYTEKYYIKIQSFSEFLQKLFQQLLDQRINAGSMREEDITLSLFIVSRLSKLEEEWYNTSSATLLLRDRTGEAVLSRLATDIEEMFFGSQGLLTRDDDSKLRSHITSGENLSKFKPKLAEPELKPIAERYRDSLTRATQDLLPKLIRHLNCVQRIFYFEINSCFEAWYGRRVARPKLDQEDWKLIEGILAGLVEDGRIGLPDKTTYEARLGKEPPPNKGRTFT